MKTRTKQGILAGLTIGLLLGISGAAFAEQASPEESLNTQLESLQELKESDPAAYRELIQQKRAEFQEKLDQLKKERKETFREFQRQQKELKGERLEYFKQNHPEAYERFMNQRRERMGNLAERNPERFREFLENHPRAKEWYQDHPRAHERFQERREEWREGLQDRRQERHEGWQDHPHRPGFDRPGPRPGRPHGARPFHSGRRDER